MKMSIIFFFTFLLCPTLCVYAQSTTATNQAIIAKPHPIEKSNNPTHDTIRKWVSNGYYGWWATGDKETEGLNIEESSRRFKAQNPEMYKKIACDHSKVLQIPYAEFIEMKKEKQDWILSHPDQFVVAKNGN